jgi:curved DNA-binding protein CbpA
MYCIHHSPSGERNYYQILGVTSNASQKEINQAYHKKAMKCHPDKNPSDAKQFILLKEAHETLSDPEKRKTYSYDDLDRIYDSNITKEEATIKLEKFFKLYGFKRKVRTA